ncbi:ATPase [Candidatus Micrarchaeota archaeon CG10_big_fil_rev_8_21_14_0_10_54_18]|nr:MAG: hypothetical protein AUJ15_01725 [Candidatus Micrarchaeota archaeon CG1_02_55_41]PIO03844.1 MAG: ATPase [Candidatus Micrarchaeota archaeon CG09_land_8_20_14_0_10_55_25]PJD01052.1 MAG: ATPase [Candidatus Micrarchaeota archaeon CG10_big_fil_rev_8_21_14_0_10_54_18]
MHSPNACVKWYDLNIKESFKVLDSSENGLSDEEAAARLKEHGKNRLTETKRAGPIRMFLQQFTSFLILLLMAAAIVSALIGEFLDAAAIAAILVLNAVLGFVQEHRAEKAIEALKALAAPKARVVRGGVEKEVDSAFLVPGDVIIVGEGDRVPADCRLIESISIYCDESALTGESIPVPKQTKELRDGVPLAERSNLLNSGAVVTRGRGRAIVVRTGMNTEVGAIASLVQSTEREETPLQKQLEGVGKSLGVAALSACIIIFAIGVFKGEPLMNMFLTSVTLAVAAIPEGLPAVVTITLAVGVKRMAKRGSIIRKLPAVETLGAATVICSDKTGTFTRNEMTVRVIWDGEDHEVTGRGYSLDGEVGNASARTAALLETAALCNNASLVEEGGVMKVLGDPTEACLLVAAAKAGVNYTNARNNNHFVSEVPFSSERKMMTVVRRHGSREVVHCKGAPEVLLEKCTHYLEDGKTRPLTDAARRRILEKNKEFASKTMRVLAFAQKEGAGSDPEKDLIFLGLAGMNDPPRPEAKEAVALCQQAGIRVVMITGDNVETAKAVAGELGLKGEAIEGGGIDALSENEFSQAVRKTNVYARVSPEHKLRIVNALKELGEVVAVTGDGVNDAPAIKRADIGVSMGITGTDVTKEASDMVVADDNFASIVAAVEEGRTIYANIAKAARYLMSCNVGEIFTVFVAILFGPGAPLLPLQILWMNLATDSLPALALAVEPAEKDLMKRKPRKRDEAILGKHNALQILGFGLIVCIGTLAAYYWFLPQGLEKARTIAFTTIILFQMWLAIDFRSSEPIWRTGFLKNKWMLVAVGAAVIAQVAVIYLPAAQTIFQTVPLTLGDWALAVAASSSIFVLSQAHKAMKR